LPAAPPRAWAWPWPCTMLMMTCNVTPIKMPTWNEENRVSEGVMWG
jgi:hypothetical protein